VSEGGSKKRKEAANDNSLASMFAKQQAVVRAPCDIWPRVVDYQISGTSNLADTPSSHTMKNMCNSEAVVS
jgi:hypothetical protein